MGGSGSGGGGYAGKKAVEDGFTLNINLITKKEQGGIRPRISKLSWLRDGKRIGSIGYEFMHRNGMTFLVLNYRTGGESVQEIIQVVSTPQPYGNQRYWMLCPVSLNGGGRCNRRCYKMYCPPGKRGFGCRMCMNLTYQSCKDSHKFDGLFASVASDLGISPSLVKAAFRNNN